MEWRLYSVRWTLLNHVKTGLTLNAYKNLPDDMKKKYSLVLAGGKGWLDEELNKLIEDLA